ncbi:MAG: PilZ domain-containing protein [Candidatus Omnitrophica bacterium]|nr:PilZ domain-containing protein [Candidatus Omnitrophota bacterium]
MVERRNFPRITVACPVQIRSLSAVTDAVFIRNSFVRNLSRVGIELISFDFYGIDGRIHVHMFSDRNMPLMDITGRIVWVQQMPYQEKFRVGVQFLEMSSGNALRQVVIDERHFEQVLAGADVPYVHH